MKFLWSNASRRSRQSFLWRRASGGIVYPFLIWEGSGDWKPTFVASPAWNTAESGSAYKYINLLSAPTGNTLDGLQSVGASQPYYAGIVTLPPLPASLSYTLNFNISNAVTRISSPTVRAMNLGYPNYDADNLVYMDFPKWEVGSFSLNNFGSITPSTLRFAFPEYLGSSNSDINFTDGNQNFDFPKLTQLNKLEVFLTNPASGHSFDCTFPLLASIVADAIIVISDTTGSGWTLSLPALTSIGNQCSLVATSIYAPVLNSFAATTVYFGSASSGLLNIQLGISTSYTSTLYVYMKDLLGTFILFTDTINSGGMQVTVEVSQAGAGDIIWQHFGDYLYAGNNNNLTAPSPTNGLADTNVVALTIRGYNCILT